MTAQLPAVGVCGFPRSGSSMRMAMLAAGGIPPVPGSADLSYELTGPVITLDSRRWWSSAPGHAVKLLDGVLWNIELPECDWRFIWTDRDLEQQARSTVKFMSALGIMPGHTPTADIVASYQRDRDRLLDMLSHLGQVLVLAYEKTLTEPLHAARQIEGFVDPLPFDFVTASEVVHERSPACAPGLNFELGKVSAGKP